MSETDDWYGWKDIKVSCSLIGDSIKKGSGGWEKEYTYIKIPHGYGYDNYCFLLSSACVHYSASEDYWWFSVCHDMKIELIYDVELREQGKRYKRYKLSGRELFNTVFKDYEVNFAKESEEKAKKDKAMKEQKDKSVKGQIVCAKYRGNFHSFGDVHYRRDTCFKAYFMGYNNSTYCNHQYDKVRNVKVEFVIFDNISKHEFFQYETIINAYLSDFDMYMGMLQSLEDRLRRIDTIRHANKAVIRANQEFLVTTGLEDIVENHILFCKQSIDDIKIRLHDRIEDLLRTG